MIPITSGKLDRRITIERASYADDGLSEEIIGWSTLKQVFAEVTYKNAGEGLAAQQMNATLLTRFRIRWDSALSDLNPKDRVVCDGKSYDIKGVYEIGRRTGLEIHAVARADA